MTPELLSRDAFVAWLTGKLEQAGLRARYDSDEFRLLLSEGTLQLHHLFHTYCEQDDEGREELLQHVLTTLSSPVPASWRECLVPRLYARTVIEESRLRGKELPHELLTDNVALTLALDLPTALKSVTRIELESWEIDFEAGLEIASQNLRGCTPQPPCQVSPGLYVGNWDDTNHSARMALLPEMRLPVRGDPVVFIPTREALLITGSEDEEALHVAMEQVAHMHGHAITVVPFRWTAEEGWTRFQVEAGHRHCPRLRKLTFDDRYQEYAEQKGLLDSYFRRLGRKVDVAACQGYRMKDETITICAWVDGRETLLPETDRVMLVDEARPEEDPVAEEPTWNELLERFGHRMELTEHWPPRWRVTSWK